ncbi:MAG: alpha-galactosidase [Clostridiaceae bacterium]|nr:alpha-galactosidase [Clostridiaceae bacterium]
MKKLDITVAVRYLSKTYSTEAVPYIGELCGDDTRVCENYTIETRETSRGIVTRVTYRHMAQQPLKVQDIAFTGRWTAPIRTCIVYEAQETSFKIYNQMCSPARTVRMLPMTSAKSCDLLPFSDEDGVSGVLGFATNVCYFSDLGIDADGAFCAAQNVEDRVLQPGETIQSDWFYVGDGKTPDEALGAYMDTLAEYQQLPSLPEKVPTGWCTWYYYLNHISEATIRENMDCLAREHNGLPVKVVQIDEGWADKYGDWEANGRFPNGMKVMADEIRAKSFIPGIWLCPFSAQPDSNFAQAHPEAMIQKPDGSGPVRVGNYAIDPTHPEGERHLRELFHKLSYEWGYRYIKLDYMIAGGLPGKRYNPKISTLESMRLGLKFMRESVTEDTFLLACTAQIAAPMGLCQGMRVSNDIFHDWDSLKEVFMRVFKRYFYHHKVYLNDPDCVMVRGAGEEDDECMRRCVRTPQEIEVFITAVAASGGILMLSDKMTLLTRERIGWLEKLFPNNTRAAVPLDLFDAEVPGILDFGDFGDTHVVALINWSDFTREMTVPASCIAGKRYAFEFWEQENYGRVRGAISIAVPAHAARVFWLSNTPRSAAETLVPCE